MRIPADREHAFRAIVNTDSDRCWTPIPGIMNADSGHGEHGFR
jgi:hypothetical protein